jgi:HAD superfamily hydrolase (TIGR01459 family)
MSKLVSKGKIVGILSNSTQLASKEIDKLHRHGLMQGNHFHFLITSGEIAKGIFSEAQLPFATPKGKFWLFGGVHPKFSSPAALFEGSGYTETSDLKQADFIYISIPHIHGEDQENPGIFREEIAKLKQTGLPMVCANPDQFAHEGNPPRAVVRQGSIAGMYEEMGGPVFFIGKPYPKAYQIAMDHFLKHRTLDPADILMVGDTPETDIRGARSYGMAAALVTKTGIMAERIAHKGLEMALQALPSKDCPDYLIGGFIDDFCAAS